MFSQREFYKLSTACVFQTSSGNFSSFILVSSQTYKSRYGNHTCLGSPVNEASGSTRGFVQLQKALFRTLHQPVNPDFRLQFWQPYSPRHVWKQKAASSLAWPSFHDHVPDVSALPPCIKVVHICVSQICSKKHLLKLTSLEICFSHNLSSCQRMKFFI